MLGVDDQFASNGPYDELLALYNLHTEGIVKEVMDFVH
jgi:transketolase C-terminal domain/subunit